MNVFKNIKDAKYFIGKLTDTAKSVKTDAQRVFYVDMINAFISLVNTAESLINKTESVSVIDSLVLARIYDQFEMQEYKSYNYAQNLFVVERVKGSVVFLGTIEVDAVVQADYVLKCKDINKIGLPLNFIDGTNEVEYIDRDNSDKLIKAFYSQKLDAVDIKSIVKNINMDVLGSLEFNKEKVINFLKSKETDFMLKNNKMSLLNDKQFDVLVNDLLEQFKSAM